MRRTSRFFGIGLFILLSLTPYTQGALPGIPRPKLVVLLVIDQFRADYLSRFQKEFLPALQKNGEKGGFNYLITQSAYFPFAQYDLLQCITGPGHATISTGAYPYRTGIINNEWFNRTKGKIENCVEDVAFPMLETLSSSTGRSPRNLQGGTLGDELKNASPESRVVSISLKDRAAILLGGQRADLALWYDFDSKRWTSSRYYFREGKLPEWTTKLNAEAKLPAESAHTEKGVRFTLEAANKALDAYNLGRRDATDLLAISLSSHDIIGHEYGPNSPEIKNVTLEEDRAIAWLINQLQRKIPGGMKNITLVLTADHGVAPSPEWASMNKLPAGRIDERMLIQKVSAHLDKKFGSLGSERWILADYAFNFYLNRKAISDRGLDLQAIQMEMKRILLEEPAISQVITSTDYDTGKLPPGIWRNQTTHSFYPERSGDVVLVPRPFFINGDSRSKPGSSNHMTGYAYDRTVPILFLGSHFRPGIYANSAEVTDIAPTLAFLLGILPPPLTEGRVLSEILSLPRH